MLDTPPVMKTSGLSLDSSGDIWAYQGAYGMVKIGSLAGEPPPSNTRLPQISAPNGLMVGVALACSSGAWDPTGDYTRQWLSDDAPIDGADGSAYVPRPGDAGSMISCAVTATNSGGSTTATADAVGPIRAQVQP